MDAVRQPKGVVRKLTGQVRHGRATVSWGPDTIVANCLVDDGRTHVDAATDLKKAVSLAIEEIRREKAARAPQPPAGASLPGEIWRPIPGFPDYEASNRRRIRSISRLIEYSYGTWVHSNQTVHNTPSKRPLQGRILKTRIGAKPGSRPTKRCDTEYVTLRVTRNGGQRPVRVDKLLEAAFPEGLDSARGAEGSIAAGETTT
jgi:hypothetical protein